MEMNILLAYIGIALLAGGSFVASAIAVTICGQTVIGAMKKRPEAFGTYLVLSALTTSQGIYGLVGFFLLRGYLVPDITFVQASAIFGVGLLMAVAGIFANVGQAKICANGIEATASGHNVTANTLIMAAFPETFGIFSLLVTLLVAFAL
ncbi:MAG: ATPase [Dysgonamonadaceae bacterium]|jgi:V/A-type H+-transporting ATPase subunit K|nr:ATPase [Dysgonamonadaceae bacterium]